MTAAETELYFKELRAAHPDWSTQFTSGYAHGKDDEDRTKQPKSTYVARAKDMDQYALGYLASYAIHRGTDCEVEPWYGLVWLLVQELGK